MEKQMEESSSLREKVILGEDVSSISTESICGQMRRIKTLRKQPVLKKTRSLPQTKCVSPINHSCDMIKAPSLISRKCQVLSRRKKTTKENQSKAGKAKANVKRTPKANVSSPYTRGGKRIFNSKLRSMKFKKWGPNACVFLPVPEDDFIEDMISENPRYKSKSQLQPMEYWEEVAAVLPPYQGP